MRTLKTPLALAVAALCLAADGTAAAAETLRPRRLHSKERARWLNATGRSARLIVKFHEGTGVRIGAHGLEVAPGFPQITHPDVPRRTRSQILADLAVVDSLARSLGTPPLPLVRDTQAALSSFKSRAQSYWGREMADLGLYFQLVLEDWGRDRDLPQLVARLNQLPAVEIAYAEPVASPPTLADELATPPEPVWPCGPEDVTVVAPDFTAGDTHLAPAPIGVDAFAAWTYAGGDGDGLRIIDVEGGYLDHSDHPELLYLVGPEVPNNDSNGFFHTLRRHGQSVVGVLAAFDNGAGTTGVAHGASVGVRRIFNGNLHDDWIEANSSSVNVSQHVYWAAKHSIEGVVLIELQRPTEEVACDCAPGGCFGAPVEYWPAEYDVIESAVGNGVVVVEAAGNGGHDLDSAFFGSVFDRDVQDSGAVLVTGSEALTRMPMCGPGTPNTGSRVDVHSWGESIVVTTSGQYGVKIHDDGSCNSYVDDFGGSSGASAIVAGVAASLQGAALANLGAKLDPLTLRQLLVDTGTPQAVHPDGLLIGPQPDLGAALQELLP